MKKESYSIKNHINKICKKNMVLPAIGVCIIVLALLFTPLYESVFPKKMDSPQNAESLFDSKMEYVEFEINEPSYFVGEYVSNEKIEGYYYFTIIDETAYFFIISEENLKNRPEILESYKGKARLTKTTEIDEKMFSDYAETLGWTPEALKNSASTVFINELEYTPMLYTILLIFIVLLGMILLFLVCTNLIYMNFTDLHPAVRKLKKFGSKQTQLRALSYELEKSIVLIADKIVITRNYLVEFSDSSLVIIPLIKITRVYEHTKWHRILWVKINLSYTLNVVVTKYFTVSLKENKKDAVETILEYLQTNYLDTKVGYTDDNQI